MPSHRHLQATVGNEGGAPALALMYDQPTDPIESRPTVVTVTSKNGAIQRTLWLRIITLVGCDTASSLPPVWYPAGQPSDPPILISRTT